MKRLHLKTYLTVLTLLLNCYIIQAQYSNTVTIYPDKDAYMYWKINDPSYADNNYGGSGYMRAEAWTSGGQLYKCRGIMQINLDCIPANATITDAKLYLYSVYDGASWKRQYGYNACYLQKGTEAWEEDVVTWNNIDGKITTAGQVTIPKSTSYNQDYIVDITDMVQDWVTNGENYGVLFRLQNEAKYRRMIFGSSDHADSELHPKVEITYELDRGFVTFYPSKDALILDDHNYSGSYDLRDNNYGSSGNFYAYAWSHSSQGVYNNKRRSLMEFDLSTIPEGATVFEAKLKLYGLSHWPLSRSNESWLRKMLGPWDEYEVTWNNAPETTEEGAVLLSRSSSSTRNYEADITDLVKDWVRYPESNNGLIMLLRYEQKYTRLWFASSDHSDQNKWPELEITYHKVDIEADHVTLDDPVSGRIDIDIPIGNPPYSYLWKTGEETNLRENLKTGKYEVLIIDDLENTESFTFNIGEKVTWSNMTGVEEINNRLDRTASGNDWENAYVVADNFIPENGDGYIEFTLAQNSPEVIIDLIHHGATGPETRSHASVKIADNCVSVYDGDNTRCGAVSYEQNDILRIERTDQIITYYLNDVNIGDEDDYPTEELSPGITIYNSNEAIQDIIMGQIIPEIPETQMESKNYVRTYVPLDPVHEDDEDQLPGMTEEEVMKAMQYFDGIGRTTQNIIVKGSPTHKDIIKPVEYDEFGRQPKQYLPYTVTGTGKFNTYATFEQQKFYKITPDKITSSKCPYSKTIFDDSPLNRVKEQGAPGEIWQPEEGHAIEFEYSTNENNYEVRFWEADANGALINPVGNEYYSADELYRTRIIDENENETWEYKDKQGRVVLKKSKLELTDPPIGTFLYTYYVYDDFKLLRYVIPPEGCNAIQTANWHVSQDIVDKWLFSYKYDSRHRMVEKKIPGKDVEYILYDKLNRVVATQDGNLRSGSPDKWLFIKYDVLGRPVLKGITNYYSYPREIMQNHVNTYGYDLYETRTGINYPIQHGYTNNAFPNIYQGPETELLTVTYYDDYDFDNDGNKDYEYTSDMEFPDNDDLLTYRTKGMVTGARTRVLGTDEMNITVSFYDKYGNIIQTYSENHMDDTYDTGYDLITNEYDFPGNLVMSKHYQSAWVDDGGRYAERETTIRKWYYYDHGNRLIKSEQKINDEETITMAMMEYNERDELVLKKLHSEDDINFLQDVDYKYNIRGWLTKINDHSNVTEDLFGMELLYDDEFTGLGGDAQYNGNISGIKWQTAHNTGVRGYGFKYDDLNRIKEANYARYQSGSGWTGDVDRYKVSNIRYDRNGNIQTLKRMGTTGESSYGTMDDLAYTYNANQLLRVQEQGIGSVDYGFIDGVSQPDEYFYDNNGNMVRDDNKGIDNVEYNHLNLPTLVDFGNGNKIEYLYDANGIKLRKTKYDGYSMTNTTDYAGPSVFNYNDLDFILTDEGRALREAGATHTYEYFLKDHLGNTRVSFRDDGSGTAELVQEDAYYPFGLTMGGLSFVASTSGSTNKYLYQGQELQDDHSLGWYQFDLRMYDPAIGRFTSVDPFSQHSSPYLAMSDNPLSYIDPTGGFDSFLGGYDMDWYETPEGEKKYDESIHSEKEMKEKGIEGKYLGKTYTEGEKYYSLFGQEKNLKTTEGKLYKEIDQTLTNYAEYINEHDECAWEEPTERAADFNIGKQFKKNAFGFSDDNTYRFNYEGAAGYYFVYGDKEAMYGSLDWGKDKYSANKNYGFGGMKSGYNTHIYVIKSPRLDIVTLVFPTLNSKNTLYNKWKSQFFPKK